MRVLMYPAGASGIGLYIYRLCCALSRRGVRVSLLSPQHYEFDDRAIPFALERVLDGRTHYADLARGPIPRRVQVAWAHVKNMGIVLRYARRMKPDLVHIQLVSYLTDWPFLSLIRRSAPVVYTVHDVIPHAFQLPRLKKLEMALLRWIYHHVDAIIVHSERNRQEMIRVFGVPAEKISVVAHGDLMEDAAGPVPSSEARRQLGLPLDARIVLFFGSIRPNKGLDVLLHAFRRVAEAIPESLLLIAGSTTESDPPWRPLLDDLGRHVDARLHYVPTEQIARYFSAADVVALPYTEFHSQSGVASLVRTYAKACVASEVGGLPDIVRHEQSGLLVPPRDPDALANALIRLLGDDAFRAAMEAGARALSRAQPTWEDLAEKTIRTAYRIARQLPPEREEPAETPIQGVC